jgi:tetratricopeptide (TPR) repeat protein
VKGIMEEHYRRVQALYNFNLPGKYDVYLCPCYLPSVIWDKRFAMAVDPTRTTAHAIFTHSLNAADPFVLAHTAVLRNYGYAPPVLSEGLANYLSFALFDMKEIVAGGRDVPLGELMDTYRYYTADPYVTDRTGATFVMYLVNEFGWAAFKQLYEAAHDLNLTAMIEQQYGRSIDELAQGWRTYVDTSSVDVNGLVYYAELAEAMFNYRLMLGYAQAAAEMSQTHQDSVRHLLLLKRAHFFSGDYYRATDIQEMLVQLESSSAQHWMTLGTYRMMNGLYDEAYNDLATAFGLDSANQNIRFNLGMNALHRGDEKTAVEHLTHVVDHPTKSGPHAGAMIMLADILRRSDEDKDRELARQYFTQANRGLEMALQSSSPAPSVHLWLGMGNLGLGQLDQARGYLEGALFLETRPFYLGMTNLWLGKLADAAGERQTAVDHYSEVLALSSADYHQREANRYLETPYTQ